MDHELDLAGAIAFGLGLYRIPAVAQYRRGWRSATPCHAAEVSLSSRALFGKPETRVRCPTCRRRWTVRWAGTRAMFWAG